ncbi:MAG: FGGY-family carbohydrate kinase, partial [Chloroflexia bacterium]
TGYGLRHIFEVMREAGGVGKRVVAVGGGTKGGLWTQIVSNVTGMEQVLPRETIGASYGDAMLAAIGAGMLKQGVEWNPQVSVVRPDPVIRELYDTLYSIYRELYPATRSAAHTLADLQVGY